jgi:hypothetical protein
MERPRDVDATLRGLGMIPFAFDWMDSFNKRIAHAERMAYARAHATPRI